MSDEQLRTFIRDSGDEDSNEYVQQRKLYDKVISNIKGICKSVNQVKAVVSFILQAIWYKASYERRVKFNAINMVLLF